MAESQHQSEFLSFIQANPKAMTIAAFSAFGKVGRNLPVVYAGMHVGLVAIFPDWLTFLTIEKDNPGLGLAGKQFAKAYAEMWLDKGKEVFGLAGLIYDATVGKQKEQSKQQREIREAMENPQSFFIPLRLLRTVETGKQLGATHYLRIETTERDYAFIRTPERSLFGALDQIFGDWHPEAMAYLRVIAACHA
ncbi:MAG TPA: hypothetical protein VF725_11780 [Ktedonobacterales bacterium]